MNKEIIKKYLKHFKEIDFYLYGQEYYIVEKLLPIFKKIKQNNYIYNYNDFGGDSFEGSTILFILEKLKLIEWGTSIRLGWIESNCRDIFDLLIILLEKDLNNITLIMERDIYNEEDIEYIYNLIK